jgi:hypothetical protein|tara:strand:+ start:2219 stop:2449 length:231 start_codon:yes stop_codon:yes gene_type:complete
MKVQIVDVQCGDVIKQAVVIDKTDASDADFRVSQERRFGKDRVKRITLHSHPRTYTPPPPTPADEARAKVKALVGL